MNAESERSRQDTSIVTKVNLNKLAEELCEVDWRLQSLYAFIFLRKVSKLDDTTLSSVSETCSYLNQACQEHFFKRKLEKFYPGFTEFKPKDLTHAQYYAQLQTVSGVYYAIKKEWRESETKLDLAQFTVEVIK
jgi:hypothetical protein